MKRVVLVAFVVLLMLSLIGCKQNEPVIDNPPTEYKIVDGNGEDGLHYHNDQLFTGTCSKDGKRYVRGVISNKEDEPISDKSFPKIDGSTSLIPLEAYVRSYYFEKDPIEIQKSIKHSSTWDGFYNLINKQIDILLTVPLSQEQIDYAKNENVELVGTPISKDGFVFVVNKDNPVDTLTIQQIKDIYSGKITNWKQVGGNDVSILAYQRNSDSGSQNYMEEFMSDSKLMDAPTMKTASMGGAIDVVASNDNSINSISYSYFSYAANMYYDANKIKFIKINGIEPTLESISKNSYPLVCFNYIYTNGTPKEDSNTKKVIDFIVSKQGQEYVANAGYATLEDYGFKYPTLKKDNFYNGIGKTTFENNIISFGYQLSETTSTVKNEINFLKNKQFEKQINDYISSTINKLSFKETGVSIFVRNGYLLMRIFKRNNNVIDNHFDNSDFSYWDIVNDKKIELEDLFINGTDIDIYLCKYINKGLNSQWSGFDHDINIYSLFKNTFGIDGNYVYISDIYETKDYSIGSSDQYVTKFQIEDDENNPVLSFNYCRNFIDKIDTTKCEYEKYIVTKDCSETSKTYIYYQLKKDICPAYEIINKKALDFFSTNFSEEKMKEFVKNGYEICDGFTSVGFSMMDNYVAVEADFGPCDMYLPLDRALIFDATTAEEVKLTELLKDNWKELSRYRDDKTEWYYVDGIDFDISSFYISSIYFERTHINVNCNKKDNLVQIFIPLNAIKFADKYN